MALGEADAMARRDEVLQFFAWDRPAPRRAAAVDSGAPPAPQMLPGWAPDILLP